LIANLAAEAAAASFVLMTNPEEVLTVVFQGFYFIEESSFMSNSSISKLTVTFSPISMLK